MFSGSGSSSNNSPLRPFSSVFDSIAIKRSAPRFGRRGYPKSSQALRGCRRKQHLVRYALIEACVGEVSDGQEGAD
jgi:hypothetical protein